MHSNKTCIDVVWDPFVSMQAAVDESPRNRLEVAQLSNGQTMQQLRQSLHGINVQSLPALPAGISMDIPNLDAPGVQSSVTEPLLQQLDPASRLHVMENKLEQGLVRVALALMTTKLWQNGRVLKIAFLGGDSTVRARVIEWARLWENFANLHFDFVADNGHDTDIRIAFEAGGSWSYIGTDAKLVPQDQPTMNFGWLTDSSSDDTYSRVVLHEFGHALGAIHEHQHPEGNIPWDEEAVYAYYGEPPNSWSREQVDVNLFQKYDKNLLNFSAFDPASIMLYPISNELTEGDWEVGWNAQLSEQDKQFMNENYPFDDAATGVSGETAVLTRNAQPLASAIGIPGEVRSFKFTADQRGQYFFQTSGDTDVIMSIFAADNGHHPLAEDDDSGEGWNAKLLVELEPGEYDVQVRHYDENGTGSFEIWST